MAEDLVELDVVAISELVEGGVAGVACRGGGVDCITAFKFMAWIPCCTVARIAVYIIIYLYSLTLSLIRTHSHTHTPSHAHSYTLRHILTPSHPHTVTPSVTPSHPHTPGGTILLCSQAAQEKL